MATQSPFDPVHVDPDYYAGTPNQHGNSDYPTTSEGVGTGEVGGTSGMDQDPHLLADTVATREANKAAGVGNETVFEHPAADTKGQMMSDAAAQKLDEIAENPSDDALLHRADATYLEPGDDPNVSYDPHNKGYDGKDKTSVEPNE